MTDLIHARHTVSGQIVDVPENIFNHEVLGAFYEEVGQDAKPFLPEMHRASLPKNPTAEQIAVAEKAGFVSEDEAKALYKAADEAAKAAQTADSKDEK